MQVNHPSWILCDGFESGSFSSWSSYTLSALGHVNVNSVMPHSGKYASDIYYSNPSSIDINLFFREDNLNSDHFFVRGYVYLATPDPGATLFGGRKLYYLKQSEAANDEFLLVVGMEDWPYGSSSYVPGNLTLTAGTWFNGSNSTSHHSTGAGENLHYDHWYSIELEVKLNTPGQSDGYMNLWVDGVRDPGVSPQNISLRGNYSEKFNYLEIGRQADPWVQTGLYSLVQSPAASEHRYWDDLVIATSAIGPQAPTGVADVMPPSVPTGLSAVAASASQVDLSWNASTDNVGAIGYNVYRDGKLIFSTPFRSFSDKYLSTTVHNYSVAAYDAAGNVSAQSAAVHP